MLENNKKPSVASQHKSKEIIIESERRCSISGEWEAVGIISTTIYVSKGEQMPLYCGKKVKWLLLKPG